MENRPCLHRGYKDLGPVGRVVVAFLAADRAILSVEKNTLANVDLHITVGCLGAFACTVAKGAL